MVSFTVHRLLHDEMLGLNPHNTGLRDRNFAEATIYLVRDGATIFYIGLSKANIVERLRTHMGQPFRGHVSKSDLGLFVEANLPESESWVIEIYTAEECRWAVPDGDTYFRISPADAEWCMIRHFKPCLNVTANQDRATPLPDRYKRPVNKIAEILADFLRAAPRTLD